MCVSSRAPASIPLSRGNVKAQKEGNRIRFISGNVLTGTKTALDGFLGYYANQLTAIPEGDKYELLGWAMPRLNKFSVSRAYFSWLCPKKGMISTRISTAASVRSSLRVSTSAIFRWTSIRCIC